MSKHNKKQQHQTMHKVSVKFAEYATQYFHDLNTESAIAQICTAATNDDEIPKSLVLKAINKIEDCRDQDLFYAAKDGDRDARPSKEITQMIKLLKQALATKASGEAVKLNLSESASFGQFVSLKVPSGRDIYSSMRLPKLIQVLNDTEEKIQTQVFLLWNERNNIDKGKNFPLTDKDMSGVLRWHLRGLTIGAAIRKVRVDLEVTQNYLSA